MQKKKNPKSGVGRAPATPPPRKTLQSNRFFHEPAACTLRHCLKDNEKESADSRAYSITSDDDLNSDGTNPPPLGARDDFGSGQTEYTVQENQAILRVIDRLNCGAMVSKLVHGRQAVGV